MSFLKDLGNSVPKLGSDPIGLDVNPQDKTTGLRGQEVVKYCRKCQKPLSSCICGKSSK